MWEQGLDGVGKTADIAKLEHDIERMQDEIAEMNDNPDRRIRLPDLNDALRDLGQRCSRVSFLYDICLSSF